MKRRDFLQTLALAGAGLSLSARAAEPFTLHYALASSMYGDLPLAEILPEVKKAGATSIDLWPKKHGTQREEIDAIGHERFAAMLHEAGLTLGGTTRFDLGPLKLDDEIEVVRKLGGTFIVTGAKGNAKATGEELRAEMRRFVELLKPSAEKAAAAGVTLMIENHGNTILDSPDSLRWLGEFAVPGVGIALAPYHLPQETAMLAQLIRDLGPKLTLFYAWQYGQSCMKPMPKEQELEQMPGRGVLDFKPLIAALREIHFAGPTEIFMHPTPRGVPILETAEKVTAEINRARTYLAGL